MKGLCNVGEERDFRQMHEREVDRLYTACRACRYEGGKRRSRGRYVRERNSHAWAVEEGLRGKIAGPRQPVWLGLDGAMHKPAENS